MDQACHVGLGHRLADLVDAGEGVDTHRARLHARIEPSADVIGQSALNADFVEQTAADFWATGLSPDHHPAQFARPRLDAIGAVSIAGLQQVDDRTRVLVGGVVTHRQRPATAQGTIFVNLEDETGILNVICSAGVWARYRRVARASAALLVRGMLERTEGVTSLVAERIEPLPLATQTGKSRDFR